MTGRQEELFAFSEQYRWAMLLAREAYDAYDDALEAAPLEDVLAAASRPSAHPDPVGVVWPKRGDS